MNNLKSYHELPEDYKTALESVIANVLGDESPEMNDAFRAWQAGIFDAGTSYEDQWPDLKALEIDALAFREGWERREQASVRVDAV